MNLEFGPFQKKSESLCLSAGMRDLLLPFHRQMFCWIDEWFELTLEQAVEFEKATQKRLNALQFNTKSGKADDSADALGAEAPVAVVSEENQVLTPVQVKKGKSCAK